MGWILEKGVGTTLVSNLVLIAAAPPSTTHDVIGLALQHRTVHYGSWSSTPHTSQDSAALAGRNPAPNPPRQSGPETPPSKTAESVSQREEAAVAAARAPVRTPLEVPLELNGRFVGTISVEVDLQGSGLVDALRLINILRPALDRAIVSAIEDRVAGRQKVEIADLSFDGFSLAFDSGALTLRAQVSVSNVAQSRISIAEPEPAPDPAAFSPQEDFAAGLNLTAGQRYAHNDDGGFDPVRAALNGFVSIGGFGGVTLTGGIDYDSSAGGTRWQRREVRLIKDFYSSAVRATAGEFTPLSFGFQGSGRMLGLSLERAYSTIRPFQNVRPIGRQTFTLDREATVDVFINTIRSRTLLLQPGRYDVSDFPFASGTNSVRLEIEDISGRREIAAFDIFSDTALLSTGVTEFGFAAGLREAGSQLTYGGGPVITGFLLNGAADNLTLGAHAQVTEFAGQAGGVLVWGTMIGLFQIENAVSQSLNKGKSGLALSMDYRGEFSILERNDLRVVLTGVYRTRYFQDSFLQEPRNPQIWQIATQANWRAPIGLSLGVGYAYSRGRSPFGDVERIDLSLGRSFGPIGLTLGVSRIEDERGRNWRIGGGASVRFGSRFYGNARYDSQREMKELEISRAPNGELDDVNGSLRLGDDQDARGLSGRLNYVHNRFDAIVRHDRSIARSVRGSSFAQSSWAINTFIGYAGEQIAIGRPAPEGFIIASRHPTLSESRLDVSAGERVIARSGFFGPALVPINRAYGVQRFEAKVEPLPIGYDIGAGAFSVFPSLGAGYHFQIGSDASRMAVGTLVSSKGPIELAGGTVERISAGKAISRPFFTNKIGRFVADGLSPGRYRIVIGGRPVGEFELREDQEGMINVGKIEARLD
ncbi:hypothetical protein [Sphingomonas sp. S2-65]|uniref:hypothetical protein n=1 Tax=Sphingomonas sp. S2-65 TaxID=2903960 RepID=UPI001F16C4D6|nr:hypothetical protein [Sphingomonas sp. S2-65]UYY57087.1 hypothetical protein LZ586_10345 [Sphingomonas sp. S2-65]